MTRGWNDIEKIAVLGIERRADHMYYIKNGDVWGTPRKKPGIETRGGAELIAKAGIEMDYTTWLYFLDQDGDIARKHRLPDPELVAARKARQAAARKLRGLKKVAKKKVAKKKVAKKKRAQKKAPPRTAAHDVATTSRRR